MDEAKIEEVLNDAELIHLLRRFFLLIKVYSTGMHFEMPEDVSATLQQKFVDERQKEAATKKEGERLETGAETLHLWLALSRMTSMSMGEQSLKPEVFERVMNLEEKRRARV